MSAETPDVLHSWRRIGGGQKDHYVVRVEREGGRSGWLVTAECGIIGWTFFANPKPSPHCKRCSS